MGRVSDARQRLMDAVLNLMWTGSYGSTTVDLICEKAGVKKGSFYYFFSSKAELAAAALECDWQARRPQLDALFSATVPPLERIQHFCELAYRKQLALKKECGCVLGCPLYTLGSEICTQEQQLRAKVQDILGQYRKYVESAIRDAHADQLINAPDAAGKARMIQAYYEGLLTQARIQNDAEVLRELPCGVFAMLGVRYEALMAA
jgi:TetR/AcrR family transcriptional regulator, transcriptional repressor for nem operon